MQRLLKGNLSRKKKLVVILAFIILVPIFWPVIFCLAAICDMSLGRQEQAIALAVIFLITFLWLGVLGYVTLC